MLSLLWWWWWLMMILIVGKSSLLTDYQVDFCLSSSLRWLLFCFQPKWWVDFCLKGILCKIMVMPFFSAEVLGWFLSHKVYHVGHDDGSIVFSLNHWWRLLKLQPDFRIQISFREGIKMSLRCDFWVWILTFQDSGFYLVPPMLNVGLISITEGKPCLRWWR